MNPMKQDVTIDEVGRLVLPKAVRESLGIRGRTDVAIEVVGDTVRISVPSPPPGPTKRRRGRMVYCGPLPEDWDSGEAVARMREGRIKR